MKAVEVVLGCRQLLGMREEWRRQCPRLSHLVCLDGIIMMRMKSCFRPKPRSCKKVHRLGIDQPSFVWISSGVWFRLWISSCEKLQKPPRLQTRWLVRSTVCSHITFNCAETTNNFSRSIRKQLICIGGKITCTVWMKKYAVFFGRQKRKHSSAHSRKMSLVQFERHWKTLQTHTPHPLHKQIQTPTPKKILLDNWSSLKVCHLSIWSLFF